MNNSFGRFSLLFLFLPYTLAQFGGIGETLHRALDDILGAIDVIGQPIDPGDVEFFSKTFQDSRNGEDAIHPFDFQFAAQTEGHIFFFIHGWSQNRTSCPWFEPLAEVILEQNPTSHVVLVDWGKVAQQSYTSAIASAEGVGQVIASVIQKLVKDFAVSQHKIVLIGHSMGAQITGYTGKAYKRLTNENLGRIIALDPAGPIFHIRPESGRLSKTDANVVFVVHTDRLKFGFPIDCGTIDFYPNGGLLQPGCAQYSLIDIVGLKDPVWCSHKRGHDVFIEAVKHPELFVATKCDSYVDYEVHKCDKNEKVSMGDWETKATGTFYLQTTGDMPSHQ